MFSTIVKIIGLGFEFKEAAEAAVEKANNGETLRVVVQTFVEKTDNKIDDKVAEDILGGLTTLAEALHDTTNTVEDLSEQIRYYWPLVIYWADNIITTAESNLPGIIKTLRRLVDDLDSRKISLDQFMDSSLEVLISSRKKLATLLAQ